MPDWLSNLPHQIPFRAASSIVARDERTLTGRFVCTANDLMPPAVMLVEAMAQFAGGLVLDSRGYLTGIDRCEISRAPEPGDLVQIEVVLEASFGGTHRFSAIAQCDGVEIARGRFYLASEPAAP